MGNSTASPNAYGNVVSNNSLSKIFAYGIYSFYNSNISITGNTVESPLSGSGASSFYGLYLYYLDTVEVSKNSVYVYSTGASYGINTNYFRGRATNYNKIINNFVSVMNAASTSTGLTMNDDDYTQVYHNSIYVQNASSTSSALDLSGISPGGGSGHILIKNNILANTGPGKAISISTTVVSGGLLDAMDYNDLFVTGLQLGTYGSSGYSTKALWTAGSHLDSNSLAVNPYFVGSMDLHARNYYLNNAGALLGISTDIDGDPRCPFGGCAGATARPDIGADEYQPLVNDECVGAIVLTPGTSCSPISQSTTRATYTAASTCLGNPDDDLWYSFVATNSNHVVTVVPTLGMDAVIEVDTGSCGSFAAYNCTNLGAMGVTETASMSGLTVGRTYYVRVFHYGLGAGTGNFTICVSIPPAPIGDDLCNPIYSWYTMHYGDHFYGPFNASNNPNIDTTYGTTYGASYSLGEPLGSCAGGSTPQSTMWYTLYTPSCAANSMRLSTATSATVYNSRLAVYRRGAPLDCHTPYTEVACNDDGGGVPAGSSEIILTPGSGTNHYSPGEILQLQVSGYNGANGAYGLIIDVDAPDIALSSVTQTTMRVALPNPATLAGSGYLGASIRWRRSGGSGWATYTMGPTDSSYTLTGLLPNTSYDVWVLYTCQNDIWFSRKQTATTLPNCNIGTFSRAPSVTNVVGHCRNIIVSWPPVSLAAFYRVYWQRPGSSSYSYQVVTGDTTYTSPAILTVGTAYNVWVTAVCTTPAPTATATSATVAFTACSGTPRLADPDYSHDYQYGEITYHAMPIEEVLNSIPMDDANGIHSFELKEVNTTPSSISYSTADMNVYPNPTEDAATVVYQLPSYSAQLTVQVYTLEGKLIMEKVIEEPNMSGNIDLNFASYSEGLYMIHLQSDNYSQVRKLMVKK